MIEQYYPGKFSPEARAAIEGELIRAGRAHDKRKTEWHTDFAFPLERSLQTYILSVFLVYAREAIELGKKGVWTVDQVRAQALEGLRLITIHIGSQRNYSFIEQSGFCIKRETQQEFEATSEWQEFEDKLLALADSVRKPIGNDMSSPVGLPDLSESMKRQLELKWTDLLDKYNLSGGHLRWHHQARLRHDAPKQIDNIGVAPSVSVTEHRFTDLAYTYWSIWNPMTPHGVFVGWLDGIRARTSAEIESVWVGMSDPANNWYKRMCAPAIENELNTRLREWTKRARAAELAALQATARTGPAQSNPLEKVAIAAIGANAVSHPSPEVSPPQKPRLYVELIGKWMQDEGYKNEELAARLNISIRSVSSLRNNGDYHGDDAVIKLANLMKCDAEDLYLP